MPATAQEQAIAGERRRLLLGAALALPLVIPAWLALYWLTPEIAGAADGLTRLVYGLGWIAGAVLLTLLPGIEAVSHERLFSPAINPLAGRESPRMVINLRYVQHTIEQVLLFAPGLLLLAWYSADGSQLRAVTATGALWIGLRLVFWMGYHIAPVWRAPGLVGMAMSMLVLAYGVARFGYQLAGLPGAAVPLLLFGAMEAWLVWRSITPARPKGPPV